MIRHGGSQLIKIFNLKDESELDMIVGVSFFFMLLGLYLTI